MHTSFTIDKIKRLYKDNTFESKLILIYIFTGARPSELLNISRERFPIDEICNDNGETKKVSYLIAGIKTPIGQNNPYSWYCQTIGLSIRDLDLLTIGMVNDMFAESRNDNYEYDTLATQEDFDKFWWTNY